MSEERVVAVVDDETMKDNTNTTEKDDRKSAIINILGGKKLSFSSNVNLAGRRDLLIEIKNKIHKKDHLFDLEFIERNQVYLRLKHGCVFAGDNTVIIRWMVVIVIIAKCFPITIPGCESS